MPRFTNGHSSSNTVLVQGFIVPLQYFQLLFAHVSFNLFEENMLIREIIKWIDNA